MYLLVREVTINVRILFEDMPNDILSYQVEHRVVVYAAFYGYGGLGSGSGEEVRETAAIAKASSRSAK